LGGMRQMRVLVRAQDQIGLARILAASLAGSHEKKEGCEDGDTTHSYRTQMYQYPL